jgi:hypothetical protein
MPRTPIDEATSLNPYYARRYSPAGLGRAELLRDASVRLGRADTSLTDDALREALSSTAAEHVVGEAEALALLEPDEQRRVREFIIVGSPDRRSLLVGTVSASEFLGTFMLISPASRSYVGTVTSGLTANGRSLRDVVETIRALGGLESASCAVPWLRPSVALARTLDFERLATRLIFVRRADEEEAASSSCAGVGTAIEEGNHRAIAAAWLLSQGNASAPQRLAFLRGVNLQGVVSGPAFWAVEAQVGPEQKARLGCLGGAASLLACCAARRGLRWWRRSRTRHPRRYSEVGSRRYSEVGSRPPRDSFMDKPSPRRSAS